jgi:spermidine synthase
MSKQWQHETLYPHIETRFECSKILHEVRDGLQHLVLFENPQFGRVLMLDGVTQVTQADEFVYHEMMTHVPLLAHGGVRDVLIVGAGDGGIAREVLRHKGVKNAVMAEIDANVIEFSRLHMPDVSAGAFDDPRLKVHVVDAAQYVAQTTEKFDAIIVDSTDPHGPGAVLFTEEFYQNCRRVLRPGGVMVTQNGVPFMQGDELRQSVRYFRRIFSDGACYLAVIPTYAFGHMAMGWASDDPTLRKVSEETLISRFTAAQLTTKYYTPAVHRAAFALPAFIEELLR